MINTRYSVPFLPVSGQVITGASTKLKFGDLYDIPGSISVGLYDAETKAIATASGNGKRFFIGYSSEHTRDFLDKFIFGMQLPKGANHWEFRGEDVISFQVSKPVLKKNEKWVLGFDGNSSCNETAPKFECGKVYGVQLAIGGSPTFRRWAKVLRHEIFTDPICCNSTLCATGCDDNIVDGERIVKELADKINSHNELRQLGVKARYITSSYAAPTANMFKYQISVMDDGSETAMQLVRNTIAPGSSLVRVNKIGFTSVYEVCAASAPSNFTPAANFALPSNCDVCPAGTTTVPAQDVYIVTRAVGDATELSTPADQVAFAALTVTDYAGATSGVVLSYDATEATVSLTFAKGAVVVAQDADILTYSYTTFVSCTVASPAPIAWTQTGTAYRGQRTMCISLTRAECTGADRLAELQAAYANNALVLPGSVTKIAGTGACTDTYNLVQISNGCMEDGCLSSDVPTYSDFGGYDNLLWEVVKPTAPVYDPAKKVGIEITAVVPEQYYNDCEFEIADFYETEPIRLEVDWIFDTYTGFPLNCDMSKLPKSKRIQHGSVGLQSGEWVLREYLKNGGYDAFGDDSDNPRMRRVMDQQKRKQVDRSVNYKLYYLQFKVYRNSHNFHQESEIVEATFAFPDGDPKSLVFENAMLGPLSKFGVVLKERK